MQEMTSLIAYGIVISGAIISSALMGIVIGYLIDRHRVKLCALVIHKRKSKGLNKSEDINEQ